MPGLWPEEFPGLPLWADECQAFGLKKLPGYAAGVAAAVGHSQERVGPVTVGWRERVALPEWGIKRVLAKIDTGARTSAIHVDSIEELPGDRVAFGVVLNRRRLDQAVRVEAAIVRRGRIRSSTGQVSQRLVVQTVMALGGIEHSIELSLVSRRHMLCRMLVGRRALGASFLVDPSRTYLVSQRPSRRVGGAAAEDAHPDQYPFDPEVDTTNPEEAS